MSDPQEAVEFALGTLFGATERDRQVKIGPSGIGDPCDHCLAERMDMYLRGIPSNDNGSLATWIGTGMHLLAEHKLSQSLEAQARGVLIETHNLYCGSIDGYGDVSGTPDYYDPTQATVLDWKSTKKAKIKYYKLHGTPTAYKYQKMVYGRGLRMAGYNVEHLANVYIPRDGFSYDDVWVDYDEYDEAVAIEAFDRAQTIWTDYVLTNRVDELASDDDCYHCTVGKFAIPKVKVVLPDERS